MLPAMKDRAVWAFVVFAVLVLGGIYLLRNKPPAPPAMPVVTRPPNSDERPSSTVPSVLAAPVSPGALLATPVVRAGRYGEAVPVQDGKTVDISSGRPVIRDDAHSRAVIDKSLKEMEDAAQNVTFGPRPAPAQKKKVEPAPMPKS